MNQKELPLYNALINHIDKKPISFHVPGHKYGNVFPKVEPNVFRNLLQIDDTEITGLDDLHSPEGVIQASQQLTADYFNVLSSYYLVGGSTAGNLAAILAVCEQGDTVMVQRNCHKSVVHGLMLANVNPIFLAPEYDVDGLFSTNVSRETFCRALEKFPETKAIILTSPNYYGAVGNELSKIITTAHSYDIPVIIDEAHGAHLKIGEPFPMSAITLGADIIVQSAHKTLPAMTMGSFLHINSPRVDRDKVQYYLQVIQSSSPSYPIMASLELARYYLSTISEKEKTEIVESINEFRSKLSLIKEIKVINDESKDYKFDLLKLTIQSICSLNGYELQKQLEREHIYTELADPMNVLLVLPLDRLDNIDNIITKIGKVVHGRKIMSNSVEPIVMEKSKISTLSLSFNSMKQYPKTRVKIKETVGEIAAESIIPYPPGIPILLPGELITKGHIDQILELKEAGARFQNGNEIWDAGIEIFRI
ncbi:aminotransferase class I/II-fold pyridoxal phosphate-dependent enzyme [Bacillus sp. Marseille-P3661]|uniref:aminotransferase class I/II-fold pyridoxal phosphate-dependent enzyme n=1 Tax=Bacillus sp. Marseille-P3661 TaxID=1936234 RepID=UPI000C818497|nr:aminotransferase class I/II-fold pyridoxal phosphate-dependent enzyme [Bacillus sp. Marseille-P3661]